MSTLDSVNHLGALSLQQGKLAQGEPMFQRALRGYEKAVGMDNAATSCGIWGVVSNLCGKSDGPRLKCRNEGIYLSADPTSEEKAARKLIFEVQTRWKLVLLLKHEMYEYTVRRSKITLTAVKPTSDLSKLPLLNSQHSAQLTSITKTKRRC